MPGTHHLDPFWGPFWGPKFVIFDIFGVIFWISIWTIFGPVLGPFWGPFWDQIGPRRAQDGPKRAIKSFKDPKTYIGKNLKTPLVFLMFLGSKAAQDSLKKHKKAPKRHPKSSKTPKKGAKIDPKMLFLLPDFGAILGGHFGARIGSKRGPTMGPVLEPSGASSQRSK